MAVNGNRFIPFVWIFGVYTCTYTSCASMGTRRMWMFIDVHVEAQVLSGSPTLLTERESHRCI